MNHSCSLRLAHIPGIGLRQEQNLPNTIKRRVIAYLEVERSNLCVLPTCILRHIKVLRQLCRMHQFSVAGCKDAGLLTLHSLTANRSFD